MGRGSGIPPKIPPRKLKMTYRKRSAYGRKYSPRRRGRNTPRPAYKRSYRAAPRRKRPVRRRVSSAEPWRTQRVKEIQSMAKELK